jgi:FKBP12-rapamycin complex-associated protein
LNKKAIAVVARVKEKLTGRDFNNEEPLNVRDQVDALIQVSKLQMELSTWR